MNYAVKILTPAESDAVEAALWYEAQAPGLGADFLEKVNTAAQRLSHDAEFHSIRFADVRRAPVERFKFYGLYYVIQGAEVQVLAVFHGRRHPRWLRIRRKNI